MAKHQEDTEGNQEIVSDCGRATGTYFATTETWQIDSELEDMEPCSVLDWCESIAEAIRRA